MVADASLDQRGGEGGRLACHERGCGKPLDKRKREVGVEQTHNLARPCRRYAPSWTRTSLQRHQRTCDGCFVRPSKASRSASATPMRMPVAGRPQAQMSAIARFRRPTPRVPPAHSRATTSLLLMLAEIFELADAECGECPPWDERTHGLLPYHFEARGR